MFGKHINILWIPRQFSAVQIRKSFSIYSSIMAPPKRKTTSDNSTSGNQSAGSAKKSKKESTEESSNFLQRSFYPPEMSATRCKAYNEGTILRPIRLLEKELTETDSKRKAIKTRKAVLHWFKRDLRLNDNRGLCMASELAQKYKIPLICLYIVSPEDLEAHFVSPSRVDFELRTLKILQKDLAELDIPLIMDTVPKRKDVVGHILSLCEENDISHIFTNIEYEVDELRRETSLVKSALDKDIAVVPIHDDCVVTPGHLKTGQGKQYSVYTPWYRSWVKHVHANSDLLELSSKPAKNPSSAKKSLSSLFNAKIPSAPDGKKLKGDEGKRFASLWPAGEHEAAGRLDKFLEQHINRYGENRNYPSLQATSSLSVHFAAGTLSARTAVRKARDHNSSKSLDGGSSGVQTWISEVAWRDFYKHVLAHWPYVCMYKPFKYEYANLNWDYNEENFEAWKEGKTGFPIVDAAMRQLKHTAYMHNRCRMIVASFLTKDLLLDWRKGETYFLEQLIDGDFASNNGGWGFSSSVGCDPQPYFRIFNPVLQSEKFDSGGDYIRKWVPELKDVQGKAIHDPYGRGAGKIAEKAGYPKPIVNHSESREKALERYKAVK